MQPFNLNQALKGKPVKLSNGLKAYIHCNLLDYANNEGKETVSHTRNYPLVGVVIDTSEKLFDFHPSERWSLIGVHENQTDLTIIGMWEEITLSSQEVLEKAFKEGLIINTYDGLDTDFWVIGKTNNDSYVVTSDGEKFRITQGIANEWQLKTKPETVSLDLPKPKLGKEDGSTYCINTNLGGYLRVDEISTLEAKKRIQDGNVFASKQDAQAWINALYNSFHSKD